MTSSTEKERLRRAAIEEAWVKPPDPIPRHAPMQHEVPTTARTLIRALDGWNMDDASATIHLAPVWMTEKPDDPHLSYVSKVAVVYHLQAWRPHDDTRTLTRPVALELMYVAGKITQSRLGYPSMRSPGLVQWQSRPATSLAKTIREHP